MLVGRKEVFSPYDVSQLCRVPLQVVSEWVQKKELLSFEIPGNHRRILLKDLETFLEQKGYEQPSHWNGKVEKFKVLIAEDEVDLLEIVEELLRDDPRFEVRAESSGFGAALAIAHWHPDLILLDFVMPGMNGFDVCKKLKADPETNDIPIIAITSLSTSENRDAVMKSGISVFLGKPFQSEKMLQTVRELLGLTHTCYEGTV